MPSHAAGLPTRPVRAASYTARTKGDRLARLGARNHGPPPFAQRFDQIGDQTAMTFCGHRGGIRGPLLISATESGLARFIPAASRQNPSESTGRDEHGSAAIADDLDPQIGSGKTRS